MKKEEVLLRVHRPGRPITERKVKRMVLKRQDGVEEVVDALGVRQIVKRVDGQLVLESHVRGFGKPPRGD